MFIKTLVLVALLSSVAQSFKYKVVEPQHPPPPPPPPGSPGQVQQQIDVSDSYLKARPGTKVGDSIRIAEPRPAQLPLAPPVQPLPLSGPQPPAIAYVILRPLQPAYPAYQPTYGYGLDQTRYTRPYTYGQAATKGGSEPKREVDIEQIEQQQQQIEQQHEVKEPQHEEYPPPPPPAPATVVSYDKSAKMSKFKAALDQLLAKFTFSSYQVVGEEIVPPPPPPPQAPQPPPPSQPIQQHEDIPSQEPEQVPRVEEQLPVEQQQESIRAEQQIKVDAVKEPIRQESVKELPRREPNLDSAKTRQSRVVF